MSNRRINLAKEAKKQVPFRKEKRQADPRRYTCIQSKNRKIVIDKEKAEVESTNTRIEKLEQLVNLILKELHPKDLIEEEVI